MFKKKKIMFIASDAGSLVNFRMHLIREFLARGYAAIALAPYDVEVDRALSALGIKFISIPLERNGYNPLADFFLLKKLTSIIQQEKPTHVFSYTIKPVIYGTIAAKLSKVANIYALITGTGYVFHQHNIKSRIIGLIAKTMFRFSLKFNRRVFFQNKDNLALFVEKKLIGNKQEVSVINGSGVDLTYFSPRPVVAKNISFLMIARLMHDKGVREYVAAAQEIKKMYPEVKFNLVGWIDTNPNSITEEELAAWD